MCCVLQDLDGVRPPVPPAAGRQQHTPSPLSIEFRLCPPSRPATPQHSSHAESTLAPVHSSGSSGSSTAGGTSTLQRPPAGTHVAAVVLASHGAAARSSEEFLREINAALVRTAPPTHAVLR